MKNTNALSIAMLSFLAMLIFTNCEKNITADLPDPVEKVVVEGSIESGGTPLVMLNRNYPYFRFLCLYPLSAKHDRAVW